MRLGAESGAACRRCASRLEAEDLRCPLCGLAVPEAGVAPEAVAVQVLRCGECGAALSYDAAVAAPKCAFCDSVMHLEQPADPMEQAGSFLPFAVSPEAAQGALRSWLGSLGFFRPSDLAEKARVEGLRPLLWPAWVVNAEALVSWTTDSDAGAGRAAWAPHAGQSPLSFANLVVPASRGLRWSEAIRLTPAYDLRTAEAAPAGPPGTAVERFEAQRSAARRRVAEAIEATADSRIRGGAIPGTRFRNVHVAVLLRGLETARVAFPAYVFAYRYGGKAYRALVHGQDPNVAFGEAPLSWPKILLVAGGALLALALVVLLAALAARGM